MRCGQRTEQSTGLGQRCGQHGCGDLAVELRSGEEAEQAEQSACAGCQDAVRDRKGVRKRELVSLSGSSASSLLPSVSSVTRSAVRRAGSLASRAAAMRRASGGLPQSRISSSTALSRRRPASYEGPAQQGAGFVRLEEVPGAGRGRRRGDEVAERLRLVTRTQQVGLQGAVERTCSAEGALSSRRSQCAAGQQGPEDAALGFVCGGISDAASPRLRSRSSRPRGLEGCRSWSEAVQVDVELASWKRSRTWCAQCTDSAVLPMPAAPADAEMTTVLVGSLVLLGHKYE